MGFNQFETSLLARAIRELEVSYRRLFPEDDSRFYLGSVGLTFMTLSDGRLTLVKERCPKTQKLFPYDALQLPPADYLNLIKGEETPHQCFQRIKAEGYNTYGV